MHVTYWGHSCFSIVVDGVNLLFDPFITDNPKAAAVDLAAITADYILISHGHGDHMGDAEKLAKQTGAPIVGLYELVSWFQNKGLENGIGLNLGGTVDLGGLRVQMVPAWHSSTLPDGTSGGTAAGFIVTHQKGTFYYSGDTALFQEMKLFARRHKIDAAFLCLGDHYTMGPEDAIVAAEFVGTSTVIGMHFDTFPPIVIDHADTQNLFAKAGKKLILPVIGDSFTIA